MQTRKILVTAALPYANGEIHLGNMVESVQTDIWVRFQRMCGHECWFICGSDAHGTPIMLNAERQGITPEALTEQAHKSQQEDYQAFQISYDNFYTTHSQENAELASDMYLKLSARGDITKKTIAQAYDPEKNMFLPDRFIKGECPRCGAADQYGDNCEVCGATYQPTELINPQSAVSGATPIQKESEHHFFELPHYQAFLENWLSTHAIQSEVVNKLKEWFATGLQAWDVSRDGPYFGFNIPGTEDKYFYVWMDAPIGYMASFKNFCDNTSRANFEEYWSTDSKTELYHFIGKDIMYFHTLFWPAMLHASNYRTPTSVFVHGFLTLDGKKMSKSRGTFIKAKTYLAHLNPEYLRYYFATKLHAGISDIDLRWDDFTNRVNAELIGKVVNIASRCAGFITKRFEGKLASMLDDDALFKQGITLKETIATHFEARNYHLAIREIMAYADQANQYIDQNKPWELIKDPNNLSKVHAVCTMGINLFKILMTYLKPIIPSIATEAEKFMQCSPLSFLNINEPLLNHQIEKYLPLITRIEADKVTAMQTQAKEISSTPTPSGPLVDFPIKDEITFEDFAKLDLRIVTIVSAEAVPEADKLIKLIVDMGGVQRQVFAGIKKAFKPADLIGKQTVMVANLKPRKMRFGMSEGMICIASGKADDALWLLSPEAGAESGTPVK